MNLLWNLEHHLAISVVPYDGDPGGHLEYLKYFQKLKALGHLAYQYNRQFFSFLVDLGHVKDSFPNAIQDKLQAVRSEQQGG